MLHFYLVFPEHKNFSVKEIVLTKSTLTVRQKLIHQLKSKVITKRKPQKISLQKTNIHQHCIRNFS